MAYKAYFESVQAIEKDMVAFLRQLIGTPSMSGQEGGVTEQIKTKMTGLGYDEVFIDPMGNVLGRIGKGRRVLAFDGHIDTVDVGVRSNWTFDPFEGNEDDTYVYGRGASDQTGGFVSALYAVALAKEEILLSDWAIWVVGSVQEEDCDGLCWQHILGNKVIEPECVVLTEPTSLGVYRGQRGRMEIYVDVVGKSAHGSAPERGDNALYKMAKILLELEGLNEVLAEDVFLGKGTLVPSEIFFTSPSRCAVADSARISIDRRLTLGETAASAIEEIQNLPSVKEAKATVGMYDYNKPSYRGYETQVPCYFPVWTVPEDFWLVKDFEKAHESVHGTSPQTDKWTFSTNGVAIMGMYGIPCVGYGPGDEAEAHAPNEKIRKKDLLQAIETYMHVIRGLKEV